MTKIGTPLLLSVLLAGAYAQDKKPVESFTDAEKAGPDFQVQGEYEGADGDTKWGLQVVADGDGSFTGYLLTGGLPGAGWDKKGRTKLQGKTEGDKTTLQSAGKDKPDAATRPQWKAVISGDTAELQPDESQARPKLKKTIRKSSTEGAKAPEGAIVLFDGSSAAEWNGGKLVEGNLLNNGIKSKKAFKDFKLHVEFRLPFMARARGQGRGNSGVYLQDRYEVQVLDSFGLKGENNECGGIYSQTAPAVNMCFPPLSWQTYDVEFRAAKFEDGKKTANARVSVLHNGVEIHHDVEIKGSTGGGAKEEDTPGPIQLQNHGNPVYFRNIWAVELK